MIRLPIRGKKKGGGKRERMSFCFPQNGYQELNEVTKKINRVLTTKSIHHFGGRETKGGELSIMRVAAQL